MKGVLTKATVSYQDSGNLRDGADLEEVPLIGQERPAKVSKRSFFESLSPDYRVHCKSQMARRRDAIEARLRNPGRRFNSVLGTADSANQLFWQA